jgi:hypothetical protein
MYTVRSFPSGRFYRTYPQPWREVGLNDLWNFLRKNSAQPETDFHWLVEDGVRGYGMGREVAGMTFRFQPAK